MNHMLGNSFVLILLAALASGSAADTLKSAQEREASEAARIRKDAGAPLPQDPEELYYELKCMDRPIPEDLARRLFPRTDTGSIGRDGGDDPGGATQIPNTNFGDFYADSGTTVGKTDQLPSGLLPDLCDLGIFGSSFSAPDAWYAFTLFQETHVSASTCNLAEYDTALAFLYADQSAAAANDDGPDCAGFTSQLECNLPPGSYYLVVDGYNSGSIGNYSLEVLFDPPAPEPCDVYNPVPAVLPLAVSGSTLGAVDVAGEPSGDAFFEFVAGQDGLLTLTSCNPGTDFDTVLHLWNAGGPCDGGSILNSNDQDNSCPFSIDRSTLVTPVQAGETYIVQVEGYLSQEGFFELSSSFDGTGSCEFPPLSCGETLAGSTVGLPNLLGNPAPDALFELEVPVAGVLTLDLCNGTDYDSYLALYLGCPFAGGQLIAANDDFCGLQSRLSLPVEPGVYTVQIEGYSGNSGNYVLDVSCPGSSEPLRIPECYANQEQLLGQTVSVIAFTTDDEQGLLVDDWERFQVDSPLPADTWMWLGGTPIDFLDQGGAEIIATGTLDLEDTPSGTDLRLDIVTYEVITAPYPNTPWAPINWNIPADCDSCQFGVLISGGLNAHDNHPRYWNNLADVYCMKRGEGYCPENLDVLYYRGTRRGNQIPSANVDTCTAAKIKASLAEAAAKIGACNRAGKKTRLEVFITNHGDTLGGSPYINLLDNNRLYPDSLTAWIQAAVDSGAACLEVEATQCFGGCVVNSLRNNLARTDSCEVTAASAVDSVHYARSKGGPGGYSRWGRPWVEGRRDTLSLQESIRRANQAYDDRLDDTGVHEEIGTGQYFRSIPSEGRCDSMQVQVTPGGYIDIEFFGESENCGNSTVYCQRKSDNKYIKLAQWNWNIPGSARFQNGQNKRRIDADTSGTGMYIIHNNNGPYRIEVSSHNPAHAGGRNSRVTDPSNREEFAGFNMGWRNQSSGEYTSIVAGALTVVEQDGMSLGDLPAVLGSGGVASLQVDFEIHAQNPWWESMALAISPIALSGSPELTVELPGADVASQTLSIDATGEWILPLGAIPGTGSRSLTLSVSGGSLELDCWDLHSQLSTWPLLAPELVITRVGDDIQLDWSLSPAASSYRVESAPFSGGAWTTEAVVAGLQYTDANAAAAPGLKIYRVIALD